MDISSSKQGINVAVSGQFGPLRVQDSTESGVILPHRKNLFLQGGSEQNSDTGERMSQKPPTTNL